MYKVKVNDRYGFAIEAENAKILVNDEAIALDSIELNDKSTHVIYKNCSYIIEIVSFDKTEKTAAVKVNGSIYKVAVKDQFDQLSN